jgi:NAD dependent epimerase/dehydratase
VNGKKEVSLMEGESLLYLTGADGFIGSHLTERLINTGRYRVRALAQYNSFNSLGWLEGSPVLKSHNLEVVFGDVRDQGFIHRTMEGVDQVVHLAALIAIPHSYISPESYVQTNVVGTLNVLEAAKSHGVTRFLHTSTSETYGTARSVPIPETHSLTAQSPYAATKVAADKLVESYHLAFGLPTVTVRPFNTFGPRQSARAIIPTVITQILSGAKQIRIGSITPTRDFSFIEDTVSGFQSILQSSAGVGETFNLGSGFEISIKALVEFILEIMEVDAKIMSDEARIRPKNSEVERLLADTSKVQQNFSWKPEFGGVEGLRAGLEKTIDWLRNPENLAKYKANVYNT